MSNIQRSIVIDADIARSSGTSEHPVSSGSRKLLQNVLTNGHYIVMCPVLYAEWNKHKSSYASRWLVSMIARKKLITIIPNNEIQSFIDKNIPESKQKDIAAKDSHLIDAALFTGKFIVSNDDIARNVFSHFSLEYALIKTVIWFNSIRDKDFLTNNLIQNNFIPQVYFLGN